MPSKNNILVQASKILPTISPFYGVNPSLSTVFEIFSVKTKVAQCKKKKSKAVPLHAMQAYWGRGGTAPTHS
jgi:hypothetical protein